MDLNSAYTQAGVSASVIFAGGILYRIYREINGKKIHSKCCDKDIEVGIRVEEMTPPTHSVTPQQFKVNPLIIGRDKDG